MSRDAIRSLHGAVVRTLGMRVIRRDGPPGALIEPDGLREDLRSQLYQ